LSAYSDLMALARLCLRQASTARTLATADELRRLAKEYEERAASLGEGAPLPANARAPSPNSNSSPNIIARRWIRLPQSVYGTMLPTGVSTRSDFAPERLSLRTVGPFGDVANRGDLRGARATRGGEC
jgi:hypothetical protein